MLRLACPKIVTNVAMSSWFFTRKRVAKLCCKVCRGQAELDPRSPSDIGDHPPHIAGLECAMGSTEEQKISGYIRSHGR